jgi:ribosomal protein S18 acetylase RimI-like enzyme
MHEHHCAGDPRASELVPFRTAEEAWERRRAHYHRLFDAGCAHLLLAVAGERVVGYAMVSEIGGQTTLATGERMAELETLSVLPGERGQGVGRELMEAAYAVIRELGISELMLYVMDGNAGATRFYERLGLRPYLGVMLGTVPP